MNTGSGLRCKFFSDIISFLFSPRVFRYGCHIFHTKHNRVKEYVQQYSNWVPYEHRVIAKAKDVEGKVKFVPMPPNQVIF